MTHGDELVAQDHWRSECTTLLPRSGWVAREVSPPSTCSHFHAGTNISWWHDIPLAAGGGTYNFYCEIPELTLPKIEVTTVSLLCVLLRRGTLTS